MKEKDNTSHHRRVKKKANSLLRDRGEMTSSPESYRKKKTVIMNATKLRAGKKGRHSHHCEGGRIGSAGGDPVQVRDLEKEKSMGKKAPPREGGGKKCCLSLRGEKEDSPCGRLG